MLDRIMPMLTRRRSLEEADAARDARNWVEARDHYRKVLDAEPERADIWVQYGHALKESGSIDQAKVAYERALEIDSQISDTHLQLGHVLKLLGDLDAALQAYRRAHELDPRAVAVIQELRDLDFDSPLPGAFDRADEPDCVALDLSDVFFYLRHHDTLSGIQRVQLGIANALLALQARIERPVRFVSNSGRMGSYVQLREQAIHRLTAELSSADVSHDRLLRILAQEEGLGSIFTVRAGDVILVLGAFWVIDHAIQRFVRVKQSGARLVVLIHDLIPITHPEYCEASLTNVFRMFCGHVLQIADLILTVSDHTGRNVRAFMEADGLSPPPIQTLRSAHLTWDPSNKTQQGLSARIARILEKPYVLYVSTIEIRKNHALLFKIWKDLIRHHGAAATPKLVFVGRPGWRVNDLMAQLESTRWLDGRIEIVHGLSDFELTELYRRALFSAFPSFEEGWGLPVGESLIFGTPCVASNTSSVPEVGGEFAVYVNPDNLPESYAVYERMIFDHTFRKHQSEHIRQAFCPRTWSDAALDLMSLLDRFVPAGQTANFAVPIVGLPAGRLFQAGHHGDFDDFVHQGLGQQTHFLFDEGWGGVEDHIRWQLKRTAKICFRVQYDQPCDISIVLFIDSVPWLATTTLTIWVDDEPFAPLARAPGVTTKVVLRHRLTSPTVTLGFEIGGAIARGGDQRLLSYGVRAFGYAAVGDMAARLELAEAIVFSTAGVKALEPASS